MKGRPGPFALAPDSDIPPRRRWGVRSQLRLLGSRSRPGALVGPIGLAVHMDVMCRIDDAVEDRLGDDGAGKEGVPVWRLIYWP
jgi:hypothetical protein